MVSGLIVIMCQLKWVAHVPNSKQWHTDLCRNSALRMTFLSEPTRYEREPPARLLLLVSGLLDVRGNANPGRSFSRINFKWP